MFDINLEPVSQVANVLKEGFDQFPFSVKVIATALLISVIILKIKKDAIFNYACSQNKLYLARIALLAGANVNLIDNPEYAKNSHLHWAATSGNLQLAKLLIEYGANVKQSNGFGWHPIHCAAIHGHGEIIELLIGAGEKFDVANLVGQTPLSIARSHTHLDIIEMLASKS
jgi:ankyrin repeat protein